MIKVRFKNPNITMKSIFSKILRSIIAIILCFVLFAIYSVIGGLMGWKHGGGFIPMIIFFALCIFVWKKVTKTSESSEIVKGQDIEKDLNTEEKLENKISEVSDNNTDEEIVKDAPKEEKVVSKDNNSCPRCCETITNPSETECKICGFIFETDKL